MFLFAISSILVILLRNSSDIDQEEVSGTVEDDKEKDKDGEEDVTETNIKPEKNE